MKDELSGKIMEEFVGLRAKLYSCKMFEGKETKKCKGVKKVVVEKRMTFDNYEKCLFKRNKQMRTLNIIKVVIMNF